MLRSSWGIFAFGVLGCSVSGTSGYGDPGSEGDLPNEVFEGTAGKAGGIEFQPPLAGAVFTAARTPPPVSGGTLLVMRDQKTAIVADPDRDQVLVVDLERMAVTRTVTLEVGSEPGRAADDASGQVHLVLRGRGQLLTLDPQTGEARGSRSVCAYPRGVAVADAEDVVHVACSEGKLVTLSATATEATAVRTLELDNDLRDVVVASDGLWVSRFRAAEVLRLDASGTVQRRVTLPNFQNGSGESVSSVAYRMVAGANGGVVVVHQRAFAGEVVPSPGGYGSSGVAGGIVQSAISTVSDSGEARGTGGALAVRLAVDVAQSPVTGAFLMASAGVEHPQQPSGIARALLMRPSDLNFQAAPSEDSGFAVSSDPDPTIVPSGQMVAVAFAGEVPVMQFREPSRLVFGDRGLSLPGDSVEDTGNTLFHLETSSGLACASCHPDGQDDGRVWNFVDFGPRRTQSLRGGLLGTEPFHWDGGETDFSALTTDVMQGRMGGPVLTAEQTNALAGYIDQFPAMPSAKASASTATIEHGKALFNDTTVGCASCHSGTRFTNNQTVDVGSEDGYLQVPSLLGVWARAPYLHDGCAKTMADRFTLACDKRSKHGNIAGLTSADLDALSEYLDTL